jgi:hypothetical protein
VLVIGWGAALRIIELQALDAKESDDSASPAARTRAAQTLLDREWGSQRSRSIKI